MLISKFDNTNVERYIKEYEEKYNLTFPEQYRKFLLKYNGGRTPKTKFKINRVNSGIRALYGFNKADEHYNFDKFRKLDDFITMNVIPIGGTVFGDYVVIGIGEDNYGKIMFKYHDSPSGPKELTEDFATFVSKCKSDKIGHIPTIEERIELLKKNESWDVLENPPMKTWQNEIDLYSNMNQEELILD